MGPGLPSLQDGKVTIHRAYTTFEAFHAAYLEHGVDAHAALVRSTHHHPVDDGEPPPVPAGHRCPDQRHHRLAWQEGRRSQRHPVIRPDASRPVRRTFAGPLRPDRGQHRLEPPSLTHAGEVRLFNAAEWVTEDGVLYSNTGYLPSRGVNQDPIHSVSSTAPTAWNLKLLEQAST